MANSIASVFIPLGIWIIWQAERREAAIRRQHSAHQVRLTGNNSFRLMAVRVTVGAAVLVASIWLLV